MLNQTTKPRMRTINEAAAYFRGIDPETALTKTAVRRLVSKGAVPSIRVGTKFLVNLDALEEYLKGQQAPAPPPSAPGVVRRVL